MKALIIIFLFLAIALAIVSILRSCNPPVPVAMDPSKPVAWHDCHGPILVYE